MIKATLTNSENNSWRGKTFQLPDMTWESLLTLIVTGKIYQATSEDFSFKLQVEKLNNINGLQLSIFESFNYNTTEITLEKVSSSPQDCASPIRDLLVALNIEGMLIKGCGDILIPTSSLQVNDHYVGDLPICTWIENNTRSILVSKAVNFGVTNLLKQSCLKSIAFGASDLNAFFMEENFRFNPASSNVPLESCGLIVRASRLKTIQYLWKNFNINYELIGHSQQPPKDLSKLDVIYD